MLIILDYIANICAIHCRDFIGKMDMLTLKQIGKISSNNRHFKHIN